MGHVLQAPPVRRKNAGIRLLAVCLALHCFDTKVNLWECGYKLLLFSADGEEGIVPKYNDYPQYWIILYLRLFYIFQADRIHPQSIASSVLSSAYAFTGFVAPFRTKLLETMGDEFVETLDLAMKASFPKSKITLQQDRDMIEKIKLRLYGAVSEYRVVGSRSRTAVAVEGQEVINVEDLDDEVGRTTRDCSFLENLSEEFGDEKSIVYGVTYSGSCISGVSGLSGLSMNLSALF